MDDTADTRPPRLAPLVLIGVLAWLAVERPGNLAGESALGYRLFTTLVAVAVVGYVGWRFHGIVAAAVAVLFLRLVDSPEPPSAAFLQRAGDAVFLATLGLGMAACARQGLPGPVRWVLLALGAAALAGFGWYGLDTRPTDDPVVRDRMQHATLALAALAVAIGFSARGGTWRDRLRLVAVVVLIPACGIVASRLVRGEWPRLLAGGDWSAVIPEWRATIQNGTWETATLGGVPAWLVGPLVGVGLWRTVARGRKQRRGGRPPHAWLLTAGGLFAIAAVAARPSGVGSLVVASLGSVLSVFGVADLVLAVVERFELKPPEPGPSSVPRVK
jgi:hypothetical protein